VLLFVEDQMPVNVTVTRELHATPEDVAAVMFDSAREPEWMKAVRAAGADDPILRVGARAWQKGRFLGKDIAWTTEVVNYLPNRSLELRIEGGPFEGTVRYLLESIASGTRASVQNEGQPTAFGWLPGWLVEIAMRTAMAADLKRLAALTERSTNG
jgi:hypothetical protein